MWTSTLDLDPRRVLVTQFLGRFWRKAYFSSFAPLRVQNLPRQPLPAKNWVRVRNRLAGICGSDLHLIYADGDLRVAPAAIPHHKNSYLGREVVGEVIEIGEDVQHLDVGDRVVLQYRPNCLSAGMQTLCRSCTSGYYNHCERSRLPNPQPIGGGWSEEMLLHEQQLFRISTEMSDEQAVLIEPTAVALHAVLRHLPRPGDRVLIIGAGTIGLLTLQILRTLAPQVEVSMLARHAFQVEQATRLGATHIIYPQDSYVGVQRATHAQLYTGLLGNQMLLGGYDVIYDTIGHQKTLHDALRWSRAHATVVLVGLYLHMMHIDLTPVWYQEIHLVGALSHGREHWPLGSNQPCSTFSIAEELIAGGQIHPEQLITHHFALNRYQHALMAAAVKTRSRAIKVVFDYSLLPASVVPNVRASARRRRPGSVVSNLPMTANQPLPHILANPNNSLDPSTMSPPSKIQKDNLKRPIPAKTQPDQADEEETVEIDQSSIQSKLDQTSETVTEQPNGLPNVIPPAYEPSTRSTIPTNDVLKDTKVDLVTKDPIETLHSKGESFSSPKLSQIQPQKKKSDR